MNFFIQVLIGFNTALLTNKITLYKLKSTIYVPGTIATVFSALKTRNVLKTAKFPSSIPIVK